MITITISECRDCPALRTNDMDIGYNCGFSEYPNNYIQEHNDTPITPEWCPIKQNEIHLKYDKS
jgi:hypothetical protein